MAQRAKLSIVVRFENDLTSAQIKEIQDVLHNAANHLAGNGMLSGDQTDSAIVESWKDYVDIMD